MRSKIGALLILLLLMSINCITFAEDKFEITMYVGEAIDLDSFLIENQVLSAEEDMSWSSGNERVIEVNSSGRVEAKEEGKSTIYAKDRNNSSRIATIKIRVVSMVESFELKDEDLSIKIGQVYNLEYKIRPVDGQEEVLKDDVEWNSANPKVVQVDDYGQIVGVKEGTTKIHAKTLDGGKKDFVVITVSGIQEDIVIDNGMEEIQVFVGGQHQFKATHDEQDVTLGVKWSNSLDDILSIDEQGVAEGKKAGRTQVKAATWDKKKFDTIMVKVVSMVEDIEVDHNKVTLNNIGDTIELKHELIPATPGMRPFEDEVEWTSTDSGIASVNDDGLVTAEGKGIALITVTSVDGDHEAHCSVTVVESDDEKKIPVQEIILSKPVDTLFVGEKYELPIELKPLDATETDLNFRAKLGSSSQVDEEDGKYYFTPSIAGKNEITIIADSEEEYVYKIEVLSPIKGIEIDTSAFHKEKDKYYLYVGQKMPLASIFELKKGYEDGDIYEDGVKWDVEESNILDIDKEEIESDDEDEEKAYDYYLVGEEKGTTTVSVKSEDGNHKDEIEIKVLSSYDKIELVDEITLPTNTELEPDIQIAMRGDLKYELVDGENFELEKEISIEHQYVRVGLIKKEIAMEEEIILDLQKSAIDSDNSAAIYSEINEHKSRLSKLELVLDTAKDGFCEIKERLELTDVFGEDYIVADIDDGVITGKRDGKIELSVTFPGTKVVETGIYYFSSDLKGILIVNESGDVVGINESGFSKTLTDETLKKQMELAVRVENRYGNRTAEDTPSNDYIEAIMNLEDLDFIPEDLRADYQRSVTRIELVETFIPLMEYVSGETFKRPSLNRFEDTQSKTAELAYDLGLVDVLLPTKFEPQEDVTSITFAKAIDRMVIALTAYGYNQDKLLIDNDYGKGQKIFADMDQVLSSNRTYVQKYAIDYGVIESADNKLHPERSLTREVFLYYISKLVF